MKFCTPDGLKRAMLSPEDHRTRGFYLQEVGYAGLKGGQLFEMMVILYLLLGGFTFMYTFPRGDSFPLPILIYFPPGLLFRAWKDEEEMIDYSDYNFIYLPEKEGQRTWDCIVVLKKIVLVLQITTEGREHENPKEEELYKIWKRLPERLKNRMYFVIVVPFIEEKCLYLPVIKTEKRLEKASAEFKAKSERFDDFEKTSGSNQHCLLEICLKKKLNLSAEYVKTWHKLDQAISKGDFKTVIELDTDEHAPLFDPMFVVDKTTTDGFQHTIWRRVLVDKQEKTEKEEFIAFVSRIIETNNWKILFEKK